MLTFETARAHENRGINKQINPISAKIEICYRNTRGKKLRKVKTKGITRSLRWFGLRII